jgi:preprotein translocase subunit SecF
MSRMINTTITTLLTITILYVLGVESIGNLPCR